MERFEFVCNLGEGAYGTVWKCLDKHNDQMVAMKRFKEAHLDEEVMHLALREIRLLKACCHPNVVRLNEAFKSKSGRVYMVMEHVDHTLTDELRRNPRGFRPVHAKLITWQLLHAAAFLHANRVVHRDIKPANILLTPELTVKLCDFGFARSLVPEDVADYTQYVVTRWYRPPEILCGAPYGSSVDVWAIGCLLCEMYTGRPLFPGQDTLDQLHLTMRTLGALPPDQMARLQCDPHLSRACIPSVAQRRPLSDRYPDLPADVFEVLAACLQLDPAKRLTALEVAGLPYFDDVHDYVAGTALQQECDDAYANALNNGNTPVATCLYPRTTDAIHARATAAAMKRTAAASAAATVTTPTSMLSMHVRFLPEATILGEEGGTAAAAASAGAGAPGARGVRRFSSVAVRPGHAPGGPQPLHVRFGEAAAVAQPSGRRMTVAEGKLLPDEPTQSGLVSAGTALAQAVAAEAAAEAAGNAPPHAPTNMRHQFGDVAARLPLGQGPLPMERSVNGRAAGMQAAAAAAVAAELVGSGSAAAMSIDAARMLHSVPFPAAAWAPAGTAGPQDAVTGVTRNDQDTGMCARADAGASQVCMDLYKCAHAATDAEMRVATGASAAMDATPDGDVNMEDGAAASTTQPHAHEHGAGDADAPDGSIGREEGHRVDHSGGSGGRPTTMSTPGNAAAPSQHDDGMQCATNGTPTRLLSTFGLSIKGLGSRLEAMVKKPAKAAQAHTTAAHHSPPLEHTDSMTGRASTGCLDMASGRVVGGGTGTAHARAAITTHTLSPPTDGSMARGDLRLSRVRTLSGNHVPADAPALGTGLLHVVQGSALSQPLMASLAGHRAVLPRGAAATASSGDHAPSAGVQRGGSPDGGAAHGAHRKACAAHAVLLHSTLIPSLRGEPIARSVSMHARDPAMERAHDIP